MPVRGHAGRLWPGSGSLPDRLETVVPASAMKSGALPTHHADVGTGVHVVDADADGRGPTREEVPAAAPAGAGRRLSVLLLAPRLDGSAAAAAVLDLVATLAARGHRAVVAGLGGYRAAEVGHRGGEWVALDLASSNPVVMLAGMARLWRLMRRGRFDVVHAHGRAAAWCGHAPCRLTGTPFVTTWHKGFREQNGFKRVYNGVMLRGDRVIAASQQIAAVIQERYGRDVPLTIVPSGVDLARFDPAGITPARLEAMRRSLGVTEGRRLVLVPSRMLRRKGHHVVLRAAAQLKERGVRDLRFVFASTDAGTRHAGELWDEVLASGLADLVQMAGPLEDMPAAYAISCVVIGAGLQPEGAPRAMLEAQAMAVPVIASDLGAGPEAVLAPPSVAEDQATGLRYPAGDEGALAAALLHVFAMSDAARRAMGTRGRALMAARFDLEKAGLDMLRLYGELAQSRR